MIVSALILAAGAGERLGGRNKAAISSAGRPFLALLAETARAAGVHTLVVVAGPPHGDETAALAAAVGARVAWNAHPEDGMASSIAAGLADARADAVLLWPVDHARVGVAAVAAVVAEATRERIVIPTFAGRGGHPTAFGGDLLGELRAARTARDVVRADPGRVVRVPVDDPGVLRDVDHPEDLP